MKRPTSFRPPGRRHLPLALVPGAALLAVVVSGSDAAVPGPESPPATAALLGTADVGYDAAAPGPGSLTSAALESPPEADAAELSDTTRVRLRRSGARAAPGPDIVHHRTPWSRAALDTLLVRRGQVGLGVVLETEADEARDRVGALLLEVDRAGPAWEAGLRSGDYVTHLDGRALTNTVPGEEIPDGVSAPAHRLRLLARELEEGDRVEVRYRRGNDEMETTVEAARLYPFATFGIRPGRDAPPVHVTVPPVRLREARPAVSGSGWVQELIGFPGLERRLGIRLVGMGPDLARYFGAEEGVLVLEVDDDAPLALQAGDVLLRVDGREVADVDHARRILGSYRTGEELEVTVLRDREEATVRGELR